MFFKERIELAPLRQVDVIEAAKARELDPEKFLKEDEKSFNLYKPKSFRELVDSFTEYKKDK